MSMQDEIKLLKQRISELEQQLQEQQVEQRKEFPQNGDEYWYVASDGDVFGAIYSNSYPIDRHRKAIGNFFKTKEQAEFAVEKLRVEAELRKFSRPFLWGTENTAILFDGDGFKFDTRLAYIFQGTIYFESEEKAQQAIETVGVERIKKYIFGVED